MQQNTLSPCLHLGKDGYGRFRGINIQVGGALRKRERWGTAAPGPGLSMLAPAISSNMVTETGEAVLLSTAAAEGMRHTYQQQGGEGVQTLHCGVSVRIMHPPTSPQLKFLSAKLSKYTGVSQRRRACGERTALRLGGEVDATGRPWGARARAGPSPAGGGVELPRGIHGG